MSTEEEVIKRKHNLKLYPFYEMFAYDLLFFYAIKIIFLNEVKGLSASQIVFGSAIYSIVAIIAQIPITVLVYRFGKRKMMIVGDLLVVISCILLFVVNNMPIFIIYEIFFSIGQGMKKITESNLLSLSIPKSKFQNEIFIRVDKKGYGRYFVLSAISSIIAGYLYKVNPYIPIVCTLIISILVFIVSFGFYDFEKITNNKFQKEEKKYIKDLKSTMHFVLNSKRLRALFLYSSIIWGIVVLITNYELTLMQEIGASATLLGYAYALFELVVGVGSKLALKYNEVFRKHSLFLLLVFYGSLCAIIGLIASTSINMYLRLGIVIILLCMLALLIGIAQIISRKYLNSFANNKVLASIYSVEFMINNIFSMIITFLGSLLLLRVNIIYAFIVLGGTILFVAFVISAYAKDKLGLRPEEYTDKDIFEKNDFIF